MCGTDWERDTISCVHRHLFLVVERVSRREKTHQRTSHENSEKVGRKRRHFQYFSENGAYRQINDYRVPYTDTTTRCMAELETGIWRSVTRNTSVNPGTNAKSYGSFGKLMRCAPRLCNGGCDSADIPWTMGTEKMIRWSSKG